MLWQLIFLGMAMGLNNALASVALGTMNMKRSHQLRTALMFGLFEAIMPIIGLFVGAQLANLVGNKAHYIGVIVLVGLGLYLFFKPEDESDDVKPKKAGVQSVLLAVALSLDNLTVGFGLGMMNVPLGLAALVFGIVSLIMTLIGLEIGRYLGTKLTVSVDKLSGAVLLLIGVVMIFVH